MLRIVKSVKISPGGALSARKVNSNLTMNLRNVSRVPTPLVNWARSHQDVSLRSFNQRDLSLLILHGAAMLTGATGVS